MRSDDHCIPSRLIGHGSAGAALSRHRDGYPRSAPRPFAPERRRVTPFRGAPARLLPLSPGHGLPGWCDRFLDAPGGADPFGARAWYDATLAHALPAGAEPALAVLGDAAILPLLRAGRRLSSLTTPYSLSWRPLVAPGTGAEAQHAAGRALGRLLGLRPPTRFEALAEDAPGPPALLDGLRASGLALRRYDHFGNWHEVLAPGLGWAGYLADRPPVLRTTIGRKLARAVRELEFRRVTAPGPELEAGIGAYEAVRAGSWKPDEPAPLFDAALMRAVAARGALRLGVLRRRTDGLAVAAQYWVLGGDKAWLLKLAHLEAERASSPGTALTAIMIRGLLEEDGVRELDFGRGDDPYKRLWVGQRRQRFGLIVADPRHPAGLLALARQAAGRGRRWLRARRRASVAGGATDRPEEA